MLHRLRNCLFPCALGIVALTPLGAAEPPPASPVNIDALLARADLAAYRGWLKFLRFEAETAVARSGATSAIAREKAQRLADWAARITADPQILSKLTGVQEWAYESAADDSGQPFKFAIPSDYDPARPAAMSVYMHGWSGNHLEHSTGMTAQPGVFQVAVLGRGRGGGYRTLSEADVLDVIGYLQAHWSIDPNRIHLNGGSMGGGGTYRLGSRYPHRWASGRPTCGFAYFVPMGNLLTYPIYATHSADDPVVSSLHDRGPLARLRELGGQVIYDETNGLGHAAWDYVEGNRRGDAWEKLQVRPDSKTVRRIDYTALDGGAVRGWWAELIEWGDEPKPAHFALTVGGNNSVFAELTNVNRLRLRLAESPLDRGQPLQVIVNGAVPLTLPAPLPEFAIVARNGKAWSIETTAPTAQARLHTPGSAQLLYNGEPLLIVYGTRGTDAERQALRAAAEAASKSSSPAWLSDGGEAGSDGVPHLHNLYGRLKLKADTEVTDAEIARCHLVLIGTAAQNAVVERLASQLPVQLKSGQLVCSDGFTVDAAGRAWGLVHFNPLAPTRLVFWVASTKTEAYAAGSFVPATMGGGQALAALPLGADLLVADVAHPTVVIARSFDTHWKWFGDRTESPLVPSSIRTYREFAEAVGSSVRQYAGADFALVPLAGRPATAPAVVAGTTRVSDVLPLYYFTTVGMLEVSGRELAAMVKALQAAPDAWIVFNPGPIDAAKLEPTRIYRVALAGDAAGGIAQILHMAPGSYRLTGLLARDAIEQYLGR
jgi:hypothetical protein